MSKEILISAVEGQEVRIAIVSDGVLDELYVERAATASRVGNIYKGRVTNVEASIQAAFVDFGLAKNGFLHISDLHPKYFPGKQKGTEPVGKKRPHRHRPPIQDCLKRGEEVVVQMTKEGIGTKGPTLTTYLSIPGRMLVMMPGMTRLGVSRKIEDQQTRTDAKAVLADMKLPPDTGFILRTAGLDRSKRDLQRDLNYLTRLGKVVEQRTKSCKAPAEIYQESDIVTRTIRDAYTTDIERVVCDSQRVARKAQEFLELVMPRSKHRVELYTGTNGLFHDTGIETEIEKIYSRRVELSLGGSLVIDQTEALVAIDVNSGRFRKHRDAETTALKINIDAAKEIARQLRLRDLGGVIVIDFIDMREQKNRREVEKALRDVMKPDRAKTTTLRMSDFGIIQITRQRMGPPLTQNVYAVCSECHGEGMIKSAESLSLQLMRTLQRICGHGDVAKIQVAVAPQVAHHLSNAYREQLCRAEAQSGKKITVAADTHLAGDDVNITATNARGSTVAWDKAPAGTGNRPLDTVTLDKHPAKTGADDSSAAPAAPDEPKTKARRTRRGRGGRKRAKRGDRAAKEGTPTKAPDRPEPTPAQVQKDKEAVRKALFSETAAPSQAAKESGPEPAGDSHLTPAEILAGGHRQQSTKPDESGPPKEDETD